MSKYQRADLSLSESRQLPSELLDFLEQRSYSLAIKGRMGTGKTALALTLLSLLKDSKDMLYISTRMATSEIQRYYPWVDRLDHGSRVEEDQDIPNESSIFVDARLDEPIAFFERVTNELMDTSSPTIVIDSWDAVGELFERDALVTNAKILQVWRQRAQAKLIFVIENPEDKTFDNLVDGVIELEEVYVDSRKIRKMHLSKLRGIKIHKPWYLFSLNKGIFHSYDPHSASELATLSYTTSGKKSKEESSLIKTGYDEMDDLFGGGIKEGSVIYIEIDPNVDTKVVFSFLRGMIREFTSHDNHVIIHPPIGVSKDNIIHILDTAIPNPRLRQLIHFSQTKVKTLEDSSRNNSKVLNKLLNETKKKYPRKKLLSILGLDQLSDSEQSDLLRSLLESQPSSLILISVSHRSKYEQLTGAADIRLRIREIEGNLLLQPESPWSSFYTIVPDRQNKKIVLDQVV